MYLPVEYALVRIQQEQKTYSDQKLIWAQKVELLEQQEDEEKFESITRCTHRPSHLFYLSACA